MGLDPTGGQRAFKFELPYWKRSQEAREVEPVLVQCYASVTTQRVQTQHDTENVMMVRRLHDSKEANTL